MTWQSIRGHDRTVEKFRRALARGRLASTFLFVGPAGIGKRSFALKLAQGLLCERVPEQRLEPCGQCPSCLQVASLNHPDVELVAKPADKNFIPLELLIGDAEHRMRAGLCYNIALKPFSGRRKVAIIDDADYLNKEGANCLLKTLEEPPAKSILILIGTSEQRQLPTIRSRCQIVRFAQLAEQDIAELLVQTGLCADPVVAQQAAAHSGGSLQRAAWWTDPGVLDFHRELIDALKQTELALQPVAKMISQFVDAAGKESAAKRQRLRLVVSLGEEFYRNELLKQSDRTSATACLDVCLHAYNHIDANVNQATLIDWWLDELSTLARSASEGNRGASIA